MNRLSVVLVFGLLGSTWVQAETIVEKRIASTRRFLPLKKLTVGPDDQYHGVVDSDGRFLVFTHKSDLVSHLKVQELATGENADLLPLTADSQEPALSPTGMLAFSYYKYSARGDICYASMPVKIGTPIDDSKIKCLKRGVGENDTERGGPFWRSSDEIGFVTRDIQNKIWRIVSQNINTGLIHVLESGKVWSPYMKPAGRYLTFEQITEKGEATRRNLVLEDLTNGQKKVIHFSLPGISGFPTISDDEKYLYFSHYLNDTNQDNVIDGSDHAVVFRVPVQKIMLAAENAEVFPEQLTSVESSCSFPRVRADDLFVTCAFEGNLDIYRSPITGIVPDGWSKPILMNALQTSRSYQDRILVMNTLKYRFGDESFTEKLFNNHVLSDDTAAARYYLSTITQSAPAKSRNFYALLDLYLRIRELKKTQPSDEVTRELQLKMAGFETEVKKISSEPGLKNVVQGFIHAYLGQNKAAISDLKRVSFTGRKVEPLERFLHFELEDRVNPNLEAYRQMMLAPELSEESQLYYAFNALVFLENQNPKPGVRLMALKKLNQGLSKPVSALIASEVAVLELIQAPNDAEKNKSYRVLDKLMSESRDDYYLRKASYVRAILNFAKADEFNFLNNVATNWLRYTKDGDTEFIYAREVFSNSALDQAYDNYGKKNFNYAGNFFYGSISLTDDLESHYGYIKTMVQKGARKTIDDRYTNLKQREFIEDNMKFVDALLVVIDQNANEKSLDEALKSLQAMTQDRDSAVRYLFMGYCHVRKILIHNTGRDFDQNLFQMAHRELMLAYDLGRDNERIKASALMNLGILHQRVDNFALSSRFFALRKKLQFVSDDERAQFEWHYAHSLYLSRDAKGAATELSETPEKLMSSAYLERQAFYQMAGAQYQVSAKAFEQLLRDHKIEGTANLMKAQMNLGFNQFKLGQKQNAKESWQKALTQLNQMNPKPDSTEMILDGLLAQVTVGAEKLSYLNRRDVLLRNAKGAIAEWLPTVIQNKLQIAQAYSDDKNDALAVQSFEDSLKLAKEYGDTNQYFGPVIQNTVKDYLIHGLKHPAAYLSQDAGLIKQVVESTIHTYDRSIYEDSHLQLQNLKLKLLWSAYEHKVLHQAGGDASLDSILNSARAKQVKDDLPEEFKQLIKLKAAI